MGRVAAPADDEVVSPVENVSRSVKRPVELLLWARAAGHCQLEGCKLDLTEHHVSKTPGNYADKAHIVAFRKKGPRGNTLKRPESINSIENLMLLCMGCHRHVDRLAAEFPRHRLESMKRTHENHVRESMRQRPDLRTTVIVFKAPIGGQPVHIHDQHIRDAIEPRYAASSGWTTIDLNGLASQGETQAFYDAACAQIREDLGALHRRSSFLSDPAHASLFALGPIPLLIEFGARWSDKISTDFYQRHQDTETWTWKTGDGEARYGFAKIKDGAPGAPVVLQLALSGPLDAKDFPPELSGEASVYELTLENRIPDRTFLRTRGDLERFRLSYIEALGKIAAAHGVGTPLNLIPAIPAPVAVICGRARHPKAHGPLRVFDMRRDKSGYIFRLEVTHDKA